MGVYFKNNNQSLQQIISQAYEDKKQTLFDKILKGIPDSLVCVGTIISASNEINKAADLSINNPFLTQLYALAPYLLACGVTMSLLLLLTKMMLCSNSNNNKEQIYARLILTRLSAFVGSRTGVYLGEKDFKDVKIIKIDDGKEKVLIPCTSIYLIQDYTNKGEETESCQIRLIY